VSKKKGTTLLGMFVLLFPTRCAGIHRVFRDYFVGNLTGYDIPTPSLTNPPTFQANSSFGNYTYQTQITYTPGLLQNTSVGINHYLTVAPPGLPAIDGLVAIMDVKIIGRPKCALFSVVQGGGNIVDLCTAICRNSARRLTPLFSLNDPSSSSLIYYSVIWVLPMLLL
jgi:hypothetical protein